MNRIIFTIVIISILLIPVVIAVELQDPTETEAFQKAEEGKETLDKFSAEEDKAEYLSREWTDFLQRNGYLNWVYKANPIFKFLFGQEFSLSWAFIAAIIIWIGVVWTYYYMTNFLMEGKLTALGIAILVGSITSNLATPKIIEEASKVVKSFWQNLFFILLLIFVIISFRTIIKSITKVIKKNIEKRRIGNIEKKVKDTYENIHRGATNMKEGSENYKGGF